MGTWESGASTTNNHMESVVLCRPQHPRIVVDEQGALAVEWLDGLQPGPEIGRLFGDP